MSKVHNILRGDKEQPSRKWYLKIHDGSSYGPVDMAMLCDWAGQSRIAPGNLMSDDRTNWTPAQDIAELKMEWLARLPDGETYGPFNVLAVPHLVQNRILPQESVLTNRFSGKTLQVKDLIKPTTASSPEQSSHHPADDSAHAPAEQQRLDLGTPLLHEAEIQHSIDVNAYRPPLPEPGDSRRSVKPQFEEIAADALPPMEHPAPRATINRDEVSRLTKDAENFKARIETAEKEIAAQIKEKDRLTKLTAKMEDEFQQRLDQTEKDLQQARNELSTIKQRAGDDYKGAETIAKQAARKEQDLNRALEETRRKAEADAAMLYRTKAQLEELKTQKAETQNRTSKEEALLKTRTQELEKQVQALSSEIQAQKSQYQVLEKEVQAKQEKAQLTAGQLKEKADSAGLEITRLKKELEAQKSLYVDVEKNVSEKEAVILKDVRTARVAQAKAEADAAALRKQLEVLKTQTGNKESEFQVRIDQLSNESRSSSTNADKLRKELTAQNEEYRKLEKRAKNTEEDLEKARFAARQAQEDRSALETRTKKQAEEIAKARADYDTVRTSHVDVSSKNQEEKAQFLSRIELLQVENMNLASRTQEIERQLAFHKQEGDKLRAQTITQDNQFTGQAEHLSNEIRTLRDELAATKQKSLEEKRSLEALERQARANEQDARRQLEELSTSSGSKTSQLGKLKKELAEAMATIAEMQKTAPAIESKLKKDLETRDSKLAETDKAIRELKKELKKQKEHYETILEGERSRGQDLFSNAAMLEAKVQPDDRRLEEANRKLADTQEQLNLEQQRFAQEKAALEKSLAQQVENDARAGKEAEVLAKRLKELETSLAEKDTLIEVKKKEFEEGLERDRHIQSNFSLFEDKLQNEAGMLANTNRQLTEAQNLLEKEKRRFAQEKSILEKNLSRYQQEESKTTEQVKLLESRLKELQNELAAKEKLAAETAAKLDVAQSRQLNTVPPPAHKEAELQLELETRTAELSAQKQLISNLEQGNSLITDELRARIQELEDSATTSDSENSANLKEEQNKNHALQGELKALMDRQKELENNAAKVQPETGTRSSIPLGGVDFLANRRSTTARFTVAVIILMICSAAAFITGQRTVRAKLEAQARTEALVAAQLQNTNRQTASPAKPSPPVPRITANHTITTYTETSCMIIFDTGLFSTRTNITSDAMDTLEAVSSQIKDSLKDYRLIIEGHSDTMKITMATTVEDNYALGMARANKVMEILANKFGLPADAMVATSTGEKDPPFPNTDDSMRKKNRTVVLKLQPK